MTRHLRNPANVNHPDWKPGLRTCRICNQPCPKGRRTFCSEACVETHWIGVGNYRNAVLKRDHGVCQLCGVDTGRIERVIKRVARLCSTRQETFTLPDGNQSSPYWAFDWIIQSNIETKLWKQLAPDHNHYRTNWEADHIVPLAEGGRNELTNLRTLCVPCHKAETKALRKRLANPTDQGAA